MTTYTLSGTGVQALSANVVALHVTITTLPASAGSGLANPTDHYGVGMLRPADASAFWDAFPISGGPQWLPLPWGTTRLGYALLDGAGVSVAEVFSPAPLAFPLASLPDVAFASLADAQVLTYQASSSKWINATPTGGSGGGSGSGTGLAPLGSTRLLASATSITVSSLAQTSTHLHVLALLRQDAAVTQQAFNWSVNGDTTSSHYWNNSGGSGSRRCTTSFAASQPAGWFSAIVFDVLDYASTSASKSGLVYTDRSTADVALESVIWTPAAGAAITALSFQPGSGNFVAGSALWVYGT